MEFREEANIFPMLTGDDFRALVDDIRTNGQIEPIWLYQGAILDGRNRYAACLELGIEPKYKEWTGASPVAFVVSMNIHRRHLTSSQRAVIALEVEAQLAEEAEERRRELGRQAAAKQHGWVGQIFEQPTTETGRAAEQAAQLTGTNRQYVSDAKRIAQEAPELIEQVRSGEMTIPEARRELVKRERAETPQLPTNKYRIVYADPPWSYGNNGAALDNYGPAERHYPAMSIAELCALPVREMIENDAALFMWVTSPLLDECWPVIKAWGFEYKTSFVWDKVKHNFGHYNSVRHELLLVCTRGSCTPDNLKLYDSVQTIERTDRHSEKPDEFRKIIDDLYPRGRRIELFARDCADGWEQWGNEPGSFTGSAERLQ